MVEAGHADACEQLPLLEKGQLTAGATIKRPSRNAWYGFIPETQPCGSTADGLQYDCSSRVLATIVCWILKIPCAGYYGDYGAATPEQPGFAASDALTRFSDCVEIISKRKSDAGTKIEVLGLTATCPSDGGLTIADPSPAPEKVRRSVKLLHQTPVAGGASIAHMQELAGKLSFNQTATIGRLGRSAGEIIYDFISRGVGLLSIDLKQC